MDQQQKLHLLTLPDTIHLLFKTYKSSSMLASFWDKFVFKHSGNTLFTR